MSPRRAILLTGMLLCCQLPLIHETIYRPAIAAPADQATPFPQRAVLADEDPSNPNGRAYVGWVIWRTEAVKGGPGQKPDIAVRADIEIPSRNFKMTMSFRRNTDASLPASHVVELTFALPPDFGANGITDAPGIALKSREQARGTPLEGMAVKVTGSFFMFGMSNAESGRVRNLQLLKERAWFDIPLLYANKRRSIVVIEKGPSGERAFSDAFAAWGQ
jgi:hypothetical protein